MNPQRFHEITGAYPNLRIGIVGDFCLDRYLEIDPEKEETSIETKLPVHNVIRVRSQPGAAGTILNNLVALGVGAIFPIGFHGEDGEGFELSRALAGMRGVRLNHFLRASERRTFTYTKPLLVRSGKAPQELNRLDFKNWTPTPEETRRQLSASLEELAPNLDALIVMDQVDIAETGVVTTPLLRTVGRLAEAYPSLFCIADSRRGLRGFPKVCYKMNLSELGALWTSFQRRDRGAEGFANDSVQPSGTPETQPSAEDIAARTAEVARQNGKGAFVTLAEQGMIGSLADGAAVHIPSLPIRGEIDIVGAGDSVTANLAAAFAAGSTLSEALQLAMAAASEVIHQLGTTGTASINQIGRLLRVADPAP